MKRRSNAASYMSSEKMHTSRDLGLTNTSKHTHIGLQNHITTSRWNSWGEHFSYNTCKRTYKNAQQNWQCKALISLKQSHKLAGSYVSGNMCMLLYLRMRGSPRFTFPCGPNMHQKDYPYGTHPGNTTRHETSKYLGLIIVIRVKDGPQWRLTAALFLR